MKKVIELIRVSTEQQAADDRASIPAQRTVNQRTCVQYGLEIERSIEIADVSGASVLHAPEIKELMHLMQSPAIDGVVAREFSRLMRPDNFTDYALLQVFVDSKTVLYLPEGPLDLGSKTGRLMGTIRAAIAGLERTEILERIWSAKEEKRRRGELGQGAIVLPFGVGYEQGKFFYKPEAEKIREAFRQLLAGNHNYNVLSELIGVSPRGAHLVLQNPIWTGWRIIDKKRDTSATGKYASKNGRQADRRKIKRAPEEIIRVRVIDPPLISEPEFAAAQTIMAMKQRKHWRSRPDYEHRFTYRGFLTCSECGQTIHTALARRDYYACKGRRVDHNCQSKYMRREKLEAVLDELFTQQLLRPEFIGGCVEALRQRALEDGSAGRIQRLSAQITALSNKRDRVVEIFIDGLISRTEHDRHLVAINRDIQIAQDMLIRETPTTLDTQSLIKALAPLAEWPYWSSEQKRRVLSTIVFDIRVANYKVDALLLNPALLSTHVTDSKDVTCNRENTRRDRGSSRRPA